MGERQAFCKCRGSRGFALLLWVEIGTTRDLGEVFSVNYTVTINYPTLIPLTEWLILLLQVMTCRQINRPDVRTTKQKQKREWNKKYEPQYRQQAHIHTIKPPAPTLRLSHPNVAEYAVSIPHQNLPDWQST